MFSTSSLADSCYRDSYSFQLFVYAKGKRGERPVEEPVVCKDDGEVVTHCSPFLVLSARYIMSSDVVSSCNPLPVWALSSLSLPTCTWFLALISLMEMVEHVVRRHRGLSCGAKSPKSRRIQPIHDHPPPTPQNYHLPKITILRCPQNECLVVGYVIVEPHVSSTKVWMRKPVLSIFAVFKPLWFCLFELSGKVARRCLSIGENFMALGNSYHSRSKMQLRKKR